MRRLAWLDVFSAQPLAGNPLAVVLDGDGLRDEAMLAFARETRLSETVFLQTATEEAADYRNRIWTPTGEIGFAGHPSLGAAVAYARSLSAAGPVREVELTQQTGAGLQPIAVELRDDVHARASMLQEPTVFGAQVDPGLVARAGGIAEADLYPELASQVVSCGVAHLIAPIRDRRALLAARPRAAPLAELLRVHDALTLYLAACDPGRGRALARAFLIGRDGVVEDPATGSAAGPLCALLQARVGVPRLRIEQGAAIGRASTIDCDAGERVRVSGDVVHVAHGHLHL